MAGPTTKQTSAFALGLAQIRIGDSATNIATKEVALSASDSVGALQASKFVSTKEYWEHFSGFPQLEDHTITTKELAQMEGTVEEITPFNIALARGLDPNSGEYGETQSGEISLGALEDLAFIRAEMIYTYPNNATMNVIFPRAQVKSDTEVDYQTEDNAAVPIVISSKRASSDVSGGDAAWDSAPLGRIYWDS